MPAKEIMIFLLLIFIPIGLGLLLWWIAKHQIYTKSTIYTYKIGKSRLILSSEDQRLLFAIIPILLLTLLLPLFNLVIPLSILFYFFLFKKKHLRETSISQDSSIVLSELKEMKTKVQNTIEYLESVSLEIESKTIEINAKSIEINRIEEEIDKKSEEYKNWKSLTKSEKDLVISAVKETIDSKKGTRIFWFIIGTIFLNITSTFIWVLLGSPGKQKLLELFLDIPK